LNTIIQITILVKDPNAPCGRPQCTEPGGQGDGSAAAAGGNSQPARPAAPSTPVKSGNATASQPAKAANAAASASVKASNPAPSQLASAQASRAAGRRRRATEWSENEIGVIDVRTQSMQTLDIEEQVRVDVCTHTVQTPNHATLAHVLFVPTTHHEVGVCVSYTSFSLIAAVMLVVLVACIVAVGYLARRQAK
jgi:hypothetical protein